MRPRLSALNEPPAERGAGRGCDQQQVGTPHRQRLSNAAAEHTERAFGADGAGVRLLHSVRHQGPPQCAPPRAH
eukprot:3277303-Alexandrium_andersonii.AAC.1